MNSKSQVPSARALISAAASMAATAMLVRSVTRDLIPNELRSYITTKFCQFLTTFSNEVTLVIDEFDGLNKNQLYYAAELYISTIVSPSTKTFRASLPKNEKKIHVSLGGLEETTDNFCGFQLKWKGAIKQTKPRYVPNQDGYHSPTMVSEVRFLLLTFHKKHKDRVIDEYLSYVLERSKSVREEKKTLKLCTLKNDRIHGPSTNPWQSVNLDHPANFDTLAMDDEIKNMIIEDLDRFVKRKEFYRKVGKAWKRGYLLFGPPGTGKSSLIAAMANYLMFDIYDLELTDIRCNSDLRKLLISTANRSILVVEDIDASIDLSERKKKAVSKSSIGIFPFQTDQIPKVTLSGLLNFIDGLWSSCGDERIIIFTTNHKEKLDPALLRPGRMDVHIQMSYCTPFGFKLLARNYLGTTEHPLLLEAEQLVALSQVTPAEIGEQLLKSDDPETALCGLVKFLELKRQVENETEKVALKLKGVEEGLGELSSGDSSSGGGLRESTKIGNSEGYKVEMKVSNNDEALNGFFEEGSGSGKTKASDAVLGSSVVTVGESGEGSES